MPSKAPSSVDPREIERFDRLAPEWWDPQGKMGPLHAMNPVRLGFIRAQAAANFDRSEEKLKLLEGLTAVDIGCGGGILSEPLARLGAKVTGLDLAEAALGVARQHADSEGLTIDYRRQSIEELVAAGDQFDLVCALEVIEHVADMERFAASCCRVVRPGGLLIMSTLNRTKRSFALAIIGAEFILRWLPVGTHQWEKFVKPDELAGAIEAAGLSISGQRGMIYNPLTGEWRFSSDMAVNYILAAAAPGA